MVRDHVDSARLERREHGAVQPRAVDAPVAEVVIVEHERHKVQRVRRNLRRHRIVEAAHHRYDVAERRVLRSRLDALSIRRNLPIDLPGGADGPRDELGGVAARGADIHRHHAGAQADERQHRLGPAALIVGPIRSAAIRTGDDLGDALAADRCHGLASCSQDGGTHGEPAAHRNPPQSPTSANACRSFVFCATSVNG